jgi:integrase
MTDTENFLMTLKLSNKIIANLPVPETGNKITYDSEVTGLGIRVTAAGDRRFVFNYTRKADRRERRYTIGEFGPWEIGPVREEAKRLRRVVDAGGDPLGEQQETRAAPTVADLFARFEQEHLPRKRARTQRGYRNTIRANVLPVLGSLKVAAVTYSDMDKLHRDISKRAPIQANRALMYSSKMFTLAIKWGMRTDNPCKGVERNHEEKRKRYLVGDELQRLTAALERHGNQQNANAIRLLLLTGARKGEVLSARWDQFDLIAGIWSKPGTTTKQKSMHVVPLSAPALELLRDLYKTRHCEHVFPSSRAGDGHQQDVDHIWHSICRDAKISGLHMHDLRHHFASVLASSGYSLPIIGQLLGHSQAQTTQRYAHLFDDVQREATEAAGAIITGK